MFTHAKNPSNHILSNKTWSAYKPLSVTLNNLNANQIIYITDSHASQWLVVIASSSAHGVSKKGSYDLCHLDAKISSSGLRYIQKREFVKKKTNLDLLEGKLLVYN